MIGCRYEGAMIALIKRLIKDAESSQNAEKDFEVFIILFYFLKKEEE